MRICKFDYKVVEAENCYGYPELEIAINENAVDGWELVSVTNKLGGCDAFFLTFKRPYWE